MGIHDASSIHPHPNPPHFFYFKCAGFLPFQEDQKGLLYFPEQSGVGHPSFSVYVQSVKNVKKKSSNGLKGREGKKKVKKKKRKKKVQLGIFFSLPAFVLRNLKLAWSCNTL